MKKRFSIILLFILLTAATVTVAVSAADTENGGIRMASTDYYQSVDVMSDMPLTFEAWINVSADMADSSKGPIVGNYNGGLGTHDVINFEIAELGVPKVYIRQYNSESGAYEEAIQIYFPGTYNSATATIENPVDLRTGELTHLAITMDPAAKKAYCYINGELASTFSGEYYYYSGGVYKKSWKSYDISSVSSMDKMENVIVGRDKREGKSLSFLSGDDAAIYSVALYSKTLSKDEISQHVSGFDAESDALVAGYDFTAEGYLRLEDPSKNNNHLYYTDTSGTNPSEYYKDRGFAPDTKDYYQSTDYLSAFPYTLEAWVNVSSSTPDSFEGAILGSYDVAVGDAVNLAIAKLGVPRVYLKPYDEATGSFGSAVDIYFPEVDLRNGRPTHLAVSFDPAQNKAYCYVNGELKSTYSGQKYYYNSGTNSYGKYSSTSSIGILSQMENVRNVAVGRDHRSGTYLFSLDGRYAEICSVALYSRMLSADEIASDVLNIDYESDALLAAYDLTLEGRERLKDKSSEGNHLFYSNSKSTALTEWYETSTAGFEFSDDKPYRNDDTPREIPRTFEANVYFPISDSVNFAGGVIISTLGFDKGGLCLEIGKGGTVVFTSVDKNGVSVEFVFDEVCVYKDAQTHVAVTVDDAAGLVSCYIDGELKQTLALGDILYASNHISYAVGGDYRTDNKYAFAGKIISCAAYSAVRSAEQIAADVTSLDTTDLMFAYDYSDSVASGAYPERLRDMSENQNDAIVPVYLIGDSLESDFEAAYSFAVVGDTQSLVNYYPEKLSMIYDWILSKKDSENIRFVMGLGDITENNTDSEWALAKEQILKLQGQIPYSLAVGNHDTAEKLTAAFENTGYRDGLSGSYGDGLENTYRELTVGEVRYLIFSLDCGASDEVLAWAGDIIGAHPEHNVIITTHAYLFRDGTTLDENDRGSVTEWGYANNGDGIWDKLVSKYENIVLVLSGHITSDEIVMSKRVGVNGNVVTEMLINPQDVDAKHFAAGLVAMLYFSEDGKDVRVEYYSTAQNQYFMRENQFETTVDTVETSSPASSFVPKLSITLDSNLIFNVYVPATEILNSFVLDGVEYNDFTSLGIKDIGGENYYVVGIPLAAKEAARDIKLVANISNGENRLKGTFTFNIAKYANKILASDNETEKTLIKDVLAYVRSAYAYFNSESAPGIDGILGDYERQLVTEGQSETSQITGISSATFSLDAEPRMVFYIEDGYSAEDFVFTQGGNVIKITEADVSDNSVRIKLYAYRMCETVTVSYKEESTSFHIHSYYEFAKNQNNEKLTELVEAFWNYCLSAREYRNEIINGEAEK